MFGLMDNIGYAIAKASMIGMAKSLTVGRKDADININCIAPNAMTRLAARTEEEQAQLEPPSAVMDAANVAPMVAYLAHESCQVSGEVYVAGGGRFARLFVGVTPGYLHPGLTGATRGRRRGQLGRDQRRDRLLRAGQPDGLGRPLHVPPEPASSVTGILAGKTALVTGASSGIGRGAAVALAAAGARVALVARRAGAEGPGGPDRGQRRAGARVPGRYH